MSKGLFKVVVCFESRDDGGLSGPYSYSRLGLSKA
jgi:hypothetical protein